MEKGHAHLVGRLYKEGKGLFTDKVMYKRFFVLNGQTLAYFTSRDAYEKQERPHKVVDLSGSRVEDMGMTRWNSKARLRSRLLQLLATRAARPDVPCTRRRATRRGPEAPPTLRRALR